MQLKNGHHCVYRDALLAGVTMMKKIIIELLTRNIQVDQFYVLSLFVWFATTYVALSTSASCLLFISHKPARGPGIGLFYAQPSVSAPTLRIGIDFFSNVISCLVPCRETGPPYPLEASASELLRSPPVAWKRLSSARSPTSWTAPPRSP